MSNQLILLVMKQYLNNATVWYYYTYKQLYVINFLFFDNLAIVSRTTLYYLLQAIMSPNNAPMCNRHSGYLRISFVSTCVN